MSEESLSENLGTLITYSFISTLILGFGLIFTGMIQDYVIFEIDSIAQSFEAEGLIGSWVVDLIESADLIILAIPGLLDIIWLIGFLALVWALCESSYYAKREGYFTAVSLLTYGILVLLFLSSFFLELSTWFNEEVLNAVLPALTLSTPFYSYYLTHAGVINAIVIVLCILLNVFDFDFATYGARKDKEGLNNREEAI